MSREELTGDLNIQEKVVTLLEEEIIKNKAQLGALEIPYETVEVLKDVFEDIDEKLSESEAMEIKQSLPYC